jgi:hypothetical protein
MNVECERRKVKKIDKQQNSIDEHNLAITRIHTLMRSENAKRREERKTVPSTLILSHFSLFLTNKQINKTQKKI